MTSPPKLPADNYLDLLNLLSEVVASRAELKSILQSSVRLIQNLLQVQRCSILLLDPALSALTLAACAGIPEELQSQIRVRLGEGIAGRVALTGDAIHSLNESVVAGKQLEEPDPQRYSTRSFICVPIHHQDRTLGVINVTNKHNRERLDTQDLEMLRSVARFLGVAIEKHRLFLETEHLHDHLIRTVESLPVGMLTVRADHVLLTANPTAMGLLRIRSRGWEGRLLFECCPGTTAHQMAALVDATLRVGGPQEREIEVGREEDENRVPLRLSSRIVDTPTGAPGEIVVLIEDLSLRREVQELRRLDELKSNFISMMSHELRTPLTSIRGSAHLLGQYCSENLGEMQQNLVRIIANNTERLIGIVNNILDISLLDNESLHLELNSLDLREVLSGSVRGLETLAREQNVHVLLDQPEEAVRVYGDADRLDQVFLQVINNAIKFSPRDGLVRIKHALEGNHCVVDVLDSGEGIPAALRDKIFDRFYQGKDPLTRQTGGTGLGLYLSRALVELHGGAIHALVSEEPGAHLRIVLPLEHSPRSLRQKETQPL
jgi:signal transduction histidine kinase